MSIPLKLIPIAALISTTLVQDCDTGDDDDDGGTPAPFTDCSDQTKDFWAYDFSVMPPIMTQVPATCRLEGGHTYVYVADDQWETNVTAEDVETVLTAYERETPEGSIDPGTGMYQNDVTVFGEPPDELDNDPKIYLFFMDIKDYVNDEGDVYSFDGYFGYWDQYPDEVVQAQTFGRYHSNEVEMVYLNARIRPITDDLTLSVIAHEFQHLISWEYDEEEETWMSESLAEVAMLVNGYYTDTAWVQDYADWPGYPLVTNAGVNYGACLLWGMYLYEQIGQDFMFPLEREPADGITGLDRALNAYGSDESFETLFADWTVANLVRDPMEARYGYAFGDVPDMAREAVLSDAANGFENELYDYGVDYIDVDPAGSPLTLHVDSDHPDDLLVRLVEWDAGVMVDIVDPVADGSSGVVSVVLDPATSDTSWTVVVSYMDPAAVDTDQRLNYSVWMER